MTAEIELVPEQPEPVVAAVAQLTAVKPRKPDSWWQAGVDEALYGETAARPRSTLGAERA